MAEVIQFKSAKELQRRREVEEKKRELEKVDAALREAMQRSLVLHRQLCAMGERRPEHQAWRCCWMLLQDSQVHPDRP